MKKILMLSLVGLMMLGSIGASAIDKKTAKQFKEDKSTFWFNDKDLQQWTYYKNGDLLKNDWVIENNRKYYFKDDGAMTTGWKFINNNWYFFNGIGVLQTGWLQSNSSWYFLDSQGVMACDTIIDGYTINSNGIWVK